MTVEDTYEEINENIIILHENMKNMTLGVRGTYCEANKQIEQ